MGLGRPPGKVSGITVVRGAIPCEPV